MKALISVGKRLLPVVAVAIVGVGVWQTKEWLAVQEEAKTSALAKTTALLWVGTATYRSDPARYAVFRDSVLGAAGTSRTAVEQLFNQYASDPEKSLPLINKINKLVDSISRAREGRKPKEESKDTTAVESGDGLDDN